MSNTRIWATEKKSFDIGCRVIKWDETEGLNFLPFNRYIKRNVSDETLQTIIKQFTVHWSVTYKAKHMFTGLKARGLSCNFMIDDDSVDDYATIYQCLPINHGGYSQGGKFNALGPGVEISYMPQLWDNDMYDPNDRKKWDVPEHPQGTGYVHGAKLKVHLPTEAQINSLKSLIWGFSELFPNVPATFPKDASGKYITGVLKNATNYTGLVNHYNLTRGKIDAAGLDLADIEQGVADRKQVGY